MAERNVSNKTKAGYQILARHERQDITAHEVYEFSNNVVNNGTLFQAIMDAYAFGLKVGYDIHKQEEKRKTRKA